MLESIEVGAIYKTKSGCRAVVTGKSRHGQDCSVQMVEYTTIDPTSDHPAGSKWVMEETLFLKRMYEQDHIDETAVVPNHPFIKELTEAVIKSDIVDHTMWWNAADIEATQELLLETSPGLKHGCDDELQMLTKLMHVCRNNNDSDVVAAQVWKTMLTSINEYTVMMMGDSPSAQYLEKQHELELLYYREDTEDSDSKEQSDNAIMTQSELNELNVAILDIQVEHDCISGSVVAYDIYQLLQEM